MPRLETFTGVRYAVPGGYLDDLIAPPYDVITPAERRVLAGRHEHNAVHLELPVDEDGADRYPLAARRWEAWRADGVLRRDPEPAFYVYRMGFRDEAGHPRQTTGVIGALELTPPGAGIFPHEHTTSRDKADRLSLMRACRANLSPIWALSPAEGLSALCEPAGPPDARATDSEGVHHRLWAVTRPALLEAIASLVSAHPVVIADGHHRYETGLAYREERRQAGGGAPGSYDAIMALVVELAEDQLTVEPIHRLLSGLPDDLVLDEALSSHFEAVADGPPDPARLPARMAEAGSLALVTPSGTWLLHPRPGSAAADQDVDAGRLGEALASLPDHRVVYQHGVEPAVAAVSSGEAQAAVLLRPATVAQIAATGMGGARLPPKTTYFRPKPRTGMVFREVEG